jgi:hypothetical protein
VACVTECSLCSAAYTGITGTVGAVRAVSVCAAGLARCQPHARPGGPGMLVHAHNRTVCCTQIQFCEHCSTCVKIIQWPMVEQMYLAGTSCNNTTLTPG